LIVTVELTREEIELLLRALQEHANKAGSSGQPTDHIQALAAKLVNLVRPSE
jgi:hypothetical protein